MNDIRNRHITSSALFTLFQQLDVFRRIKLIGLEGDSETISSIIIDDDGVIWVSTRTSGLYRLKRKNGNSFSQKRYLMNQRLGALATDNNGNIWVGGFDGKIYTIDPSIANQE